MISDCESTDLEIPARGEIVLEGLVEASFTRETEPGAPLLTIHTMTHRRDPIFEVRTGRRSGSGGEAAGLVGRGEPAARGERKLSSPPGAPRDGMTQHVSWLAVSMAALQWSSRPGLATSTGQTDASGQRARVRGGEWLAATRRPPRIVLAINVGAGSTPAESMLDTLRERGLHSRPSSSWAGGRTVPRDPGAHGRRRPRDCQPRALRVRPDASIGRRGDRRSRSGGCGDLGGHRTHHSAAVEPVGRLPRRPSASARAARRGYRPIYWTVDSGDWQERANRGRRLPSSDGFETVNGAIVVLHFDSPTTTNSTAVVLGRIIDDLRARGF